MGTNEDFAARIRTFRRQSRLSQQALAAFLGVGQRTVSRWERGVDRPSSALQERLDALIGGKGSSQLPTIYEAILNSPVPLALVDAEGNVLVASKGHPAAEAGEPSPVSPSATGEVPLVLVIEDDLSVLQATRAVLSRWEFMSIGVAEGAQAIEAVRSGDIVPKAAVIDFLLPNGLDGVDTALALRQIIPGLPVLIVTGEGIAENMRKIAVSNLPVITKPVDPRQFHMAMNALMARPLRGGE